MLKLRENIIQEENLHMRDKIQDYQEFKKLFSEYNITIHSENLIKEIQDKLCSKYNNMASNDQVQNDIQYVFKYAKNMKWL